MPVPAGIPSQDAVRAGSSPLGLRLAVAGLLLACAVAVAKEGSRRFKGQIALGTGVQQAREATTRARGLSNLRAAYAINPTDPDIAWWLGYYTYYEENERGRRDPKAVGAASLQQAFALFEQALATHERPAGVRRQAGDLSNLLVNYFVTVGDAAEARRFTAIAAEQYRLHDEILERPWGDEHEHYTSAIPRAQQAGRPELAADWYKDLHRFAIRFPAHPGDIDIAAATAFSQMGYDDAAGAVLARTALATGGERRSLRELARYATERQRYGLAVMVFEQLDRRGKLGEMERAVLDELRRLDHEAGPHSGWTP